MKGIDLIAKKLVWLKRSDMETNMENKAALIKMPMVTIYINSFDVDSVGVRWVRQIKEIEKNLLNKFHTQAVKSYLKNLYDIKIEEIFSVKDSSIAIFHCDDFTGFIEIPKIVHDNYFISKSFHLKPVFTWLQNEFDFYLLGLSKKQIKLFRGSVLGLELEKEWGGEERNDENKKSDNWENFFKVTENELNKIFAKNRTPVILAGVKEHVAFYKKINRDQDLVMMSVNGAINGKSANELKASSLKILNDIFEINKKAIVDKFIELKQTNMATDEITLVTQNAIKGNVKILAIAEDRNLWGRINMFEGKVNLSKEGASQFNDDLLDDLAEVVLARGGKVLALKQVEMPTKSPLFAIF